MLSIGFYSKTASFVIHSEDGILWRDWHIGDTSLDEVACNKIMMDLFIVQVDGDELEYIENKFPGLVIPKGRVVRFYGDTARLIAGNL